MLARRILCLCLLGLAAAGCGGKRTTSTPASAPRGPRLRLGEREDRTPARLVLEVDPRRKPVGPATLHTFNFTIEEKVATPERGRARVDVRFIEVVGASGEPQLSDQLALAMDDLKISFSRGTRGDVTDLKIDGLRAPLDATVVHAIVFTLFMAGRGPQLPDKSIGTLDDWTVEHDTEMLGLTAHQRYFYTLVSEEGSRLHVREKGHVEGIATIDGARRKLDGDTFSEETLDLERGIVVAGEYEWTSMVDQEPWPANDLPGVGKIKVRAERGPKAAKKRL